MLDCKKKVKTILVRLLGKRLATSIHAFRLCWFALKGQREAEMALIPRFCKEGDVAIDVGANGADWTLALSRQVGHKGHVYAFEADPYYAEVTRKEIILLNLKNVIFLPFGLSDIQEKAKLLIRTNSEARVSGKGRISRNTGINSDQVVDVKLERLDDIALGKYPTLYSVKFIKCDVEGFELMVFKGGMKVLSEARPVVVFELGHTHLHGYELNDLFKFFSDLKYNCFVLRQDDKFLLSLNNLAENQENYSQNRVMIPNEYTSDYLTREELLVFRKLHG